MAYIFDKSKLLVFVTFASLALVFLMQFSGEQSSMSALPVLEKHDEGSKHDEAASSDHTRSDPAEGTIDTHASDRSNDEAAKPAHAHDPTAGQALVGSREWVSKSLEHDHGVTVRFASSENAVTLKLIETSSGKECASTSWSRDTGVTIFPHGFCKNCKGANFFANGCSRMVAQEYQLCILENRPGQMCTVLEDDRRMMNIMKKHSTHQVLVDVGANRGDAACIFPHYGIKVFAFEPSADSFRWHFLTAHANSVAGHPFPLQVFPGGASSSNASVVYTDMGESASNHRVKAGAVGRNNRGVIVKSKEVKMFAVSGVVREPVGLLKIDSEGHEPESLSGSINLICSHLVEAIYIEFVPSMILRSSEYAPRALLDWLLKLGYSCNGLSKAQDIDHFIATIGTHSKGRTKFANMRGEDLTCQRVGSPDKEFCRDHKRR